MSKYKTEKGATVWVMPLDIDADEALKAANAKFKIKLDHLKVVMAYEYKDLLYLDRPHKSAKVVWAVARKGDI